MPYSVAALITEFQTDPTALGYAPLIANGSDALLRDVINLKRASITVSENAVSSQELVEAILVTDYTALPGNPTAAQLSLERRYLAWMESVLRADAISLKNTDGTDNAVLDNFQAMFPNGTGTRTRVEALATRNPASRAEQLWGADTIVSLQDVTAARDALD